MKDIYQELLTRPTFVEINIDNARYNFIQIKNRLNNNQKICCVVKGNAYGHGIAEMAKLFTESGADYLAVTIPEEGVELRKSGITIPIIVLSAIVDRQISICIDYDLTITALSDEKLLTIDSVAKGSGKVAKIHIKIDTGMGGELVFTGHVLKNSLPSCVHVKIVSLKVFILISQNLMKTLKTIQYKLNVLIPLLLNLKM